MHSNGIRFEDEVERVVSGLEVLLQRRMDKVESDSKAIIKRLSGSPERAAAVRHEAAGTIDALSWVLGKLGELQLGSDDLSAP